MVRMRQCVCAHQRSSKLAALRRGRHARIHSQCPAASRPSYHPSAGSHGLAASSSWPAAPPTHGNGHGHGDGGEPGRAASLPSPSVLFPKSQAQARPGDKTRFTDMVQRNTGRFPLRACQGSAVTKLAITGGVVSVKRL